jgi:hypothetical protein
MCKRSVAFAHLISIWVIGVLGFALIFPEKASALPSFARQTGQPCGTCHTDFFGLTPFGRSFKLRGYTAGGGQFRLTPFSYFDDYWKASWPPYATTFAQSEKKSATLSSFAEELTKGEATGSASSMSSILGYSAANANAQYAGMPTKAPPAGLFATWDTSDIWVPPVSLMAVVGFTHSEKPLPQGLDPTLPIAPFAPNDNVFPSPVSVFYGGAITEHIGAFQQVTFAGPGPGGPGPFDHNWTWDNTDVRYSNSGRFGDIDFVWGITANNNPSVQDVWNTTPAWKFPFVATTLISGPSAGTIIDGAFAAHVVGVGAYAWINDLVYLEVTGYKTLDFRTQNNLGANPFNAPGLISGAAPYFRIAVEPQWGYHSLELGAFGMLANVAPWLNPIDGSTNAASITDKYTDIGFDAQYQYNGGHYWFTVRASYIHERQQLDASSVLCCSGGNPLAANSKNELNTFRGEASLAYGADNRIILTGQYFSTWGSFDPFFFGGLYGTGIPNSNGWVFELAYIPFSMSKSPLWPWFNARLGAQYIYYNEFDGDRIHAHDNNTWFLYAWIAM